MSDPTPPPPAEEPPPAAEQPPVAPAPPATPSVPPTSYPRYADVAAEAGLTPQPYGAPEQLGPVGQLRGTGFAILLTIVTLGIYSWYWYYKTHEEMKAHSGQGIGGGLALVLAIFVGIVMPFISSSEIGNLYARRGQQPPVTAKTALWYFPGMFIIVGPFIWFIKTNGAINDYWRSLGATG